MKSTFLILTLAVLLGSASSVFAEEGMGSVEHEKGTMMDQPVDTANEMHVATEEEVKTLPNVGNKICPVSGDKIPAPGEKSDMGEPVKYEYNEKIYNLCCSMCVKDFKKDPEKYSKIAEDEVKVGETQMSDQGEMGQDHSKHEHQHHE